MAELNVQMSGKALFFKTISVQQHQIYSDFRPEPEGTSPQQALEFLRQDPAVREKVPLAQGLPSAAK